MLKVSICSRDGHELKEWDKVAHCSWTVLQVEVDTEEKPSPHTGNHVLGSALGKSVRLRD